MSSPSYTQTQLHALTSLHRNATRLNTALRRPYTTPAQYTALSSYLRDHIFTHLGIGALPIGPTTRDATFSLANRLTRAFFADGRARELGWLCRDLEREGLVATGRERRVWAALREVLQGLLVLPSGRGEKPREEIVRVLRGWDEGEEAWEVRSEPGKNWDSTSGPSSAREAGAVAKPQRRFSFPQPAREHVRCTVPGRTYPWPALDLDSVRRVTLTGVEGIDDMTVGEGDVDEPSEEGDDHYSAQQASLWTAIQEENQRRKADNAWADEVAGRLAEGAAVRAGEEWASLSASDSDVEDEFDGSEEGVYVSALEDGGEDEDVSRQESLTSPTTASDGGQASMLEGMKAMSVSSVVAEEQGELNSYACELCSRKFSGAFALNEHYREHFEE